MNYSLIAYKVSLFIVQHVLNPNPSGKASMTFWLRAFAQDIEDGAYDI